MNSEDLKVLMNSYAKSKKNDIALDYLDQDKSILENIPDKYFYYKAFFLFKKNEINKANEYFLKISGQYRKDNKYYFLAGQINELLGNNDIAEQYYFIALRKQPMKKAYAVKYFSFLSKLNDFESYLPKIKKLIINKPDKNYYIQFELAKCYILNKSFLDGVDLFKKLIRDDDENDEIYLELAYFYLKNNDINQASLYFLKVKKVTNINYFLELVDALSSNQSFEIDSIYNFKYKYVENCESLNIVFSPETDKFILQGYSFKNSTLFISEKFYSYYTFMAPDLAKYIVKFALARDIKKINLTGSSKGSFAAINIGILISKIFKNLTVNVVAFSPQTQLYPVNKNISKLSSYNEILRRTTHNKLCKKYFEEYGAINNNLEDENIKITVIYGENHRRDRIEAERLNDFNKVKLLAITEYPLHTTIVLFIRKGQKLIDSLTRKVKKISKDDAFFMNEKHDEQVAHILQRLDQYNFELNDMFI